MSCEIVMEKEGRAVIALDEHVGIASAAELHGVLLKLALSAPSVTVDAQRVLSIHTSIVQILLSARRSVPGFELSSPSPAFAAALDRLGMQGLLLSSTQQPPPAPGTSESKS